MSDSRLQTICCYDTPLGAGESTGIDRQQVLVLQHYNELYQLNQALKQLDRLSYSSI